jgi:transposase
MAQYDIATRAQALAYKQYGLPNSEIESLTGITARHVNRLLDRAIERGFDPSAPRPVIRDSYVADAVRTGRPRKQEAVKDEILSKVRFNRRGRKKTCAHIANEIGGVSAMTVWRILHSAGMKKTKPTRKPGLTESIRKERLA